MARYGFERPACFAEGFLPSRHAQPLPWPVGVQEEYDVAWHVSGADAAPPDGDGETATADLDPVVAATVQRVVPRGLRWRRHRP